MKIALGIIGAVDTPTEFITTWQTTTADESITLPLISSGTYDFTVDWGDGSSDTITAHDDLAREHSYATAGEYEVVIDGACEGWNFFDVPASKDSIVNVKNWGDLRLGGSAPSAFRGCGNLDVTATDAPDLAGVNSLNLIFWQCGSMVGSPAFSAWDVSGVDNLRSVFRDTPFDQDIGGWDVSGVTTIAFIFSGSSFNRDIGDWDVSGITDMSDAFRSAPFNQDIGGWDVSSANNMNNLFRGSSFNRDIGDWDLRRAGVTMSEMLTECDMSTENYSRTLIGWANYVASSPGGPFDVSLGATGLTYDGTVYEPGATYTNAVDARAHLTELVSEGGAGWTITDGGLA